MDIESLLVTGCPEARSSERVLHLQVGASPVRLTSRHCAASCDLPGQWQGLFAMNGAIDVSGSVQIRPIADAPLVKLQVFIDLAEALADHSARQTAWAAIPMPDAAGHSQRVLERWYIAQAIAGGPDYQAFAGVLRNCESYWLVRFLLEQGTHSEKLTTLAQRYGVSVSHFRRLCRQALGSAAKPALRDWRTAQALLDMSLQKGSLTDVALAFGFASSSHFSREIRELVGFSPSSLADITYLPGK